MLVNTKKPLEFQRTCTWEKIDISDFTYMSVSGHFCVFKFSLRKSVQEIIMMDVGPLL